MDFEAFIRARITELRMKKNVSEHRMSLDLGKSGSYLRGISSGAALPSLKEMFNIISYFEMTPSEFFSPMEPSDTPYAILCERLRGLDDTDLEKVNTFLTWIGK
jgi:transcriptional regulator with XRE-family HTH domain